MDNFLRPQGEGSTPSYRCPMVVRSGEGLPCLLEDGGGGSDGEPLLFSEGRKADF